MESATEWVEMRVADVRKRPAEGERPAMHTVMLDEVGGARRLPIWIGQFEAEAMMIQLGRVPLARPLTYTLMGNLLEALGADLREVRISRIVENTYYAVAVVEGPGGGREIDARPSDAINLALITGAPIKVHAGIVEGTENVSPEYRLSIERLYGEGTEGVAEFVARLQQGPGRHSTK